MSTRSSTLNPRLAALSVAIAVLGAGLMSISWEWLETVEHLAVDLRFQARGTTQENSDTIIVGVTDSSFTIASRAPSIAAEIPAMATMAEDWPWDRSVFAELVRRLRASGARLIVFDIVFAAETAGDDDFARALAEPGAPVVLASWWQEAHSTIGEGTVTLVEPREIFFQAIEARCGYANVWPDDDGVLRQLTTTLQPSEMLGYPRNEMEPAQASLAFAAAQVLLPGLIADAGFINYLRAPGNIPTLPIEDIFLPDRWNGSWLQSGRAFQDQIVWVGPLSEIRFKDYHATPFGRMAGVETQAQALSTLLNEGTLHPLSTSTRLAWIWLLAFGGVFATWICRRVSLQILVIGSGALIWGGSALVLFSMSNLVIPMVAPLAAWAIAGTGGVGVRFITEQRERKRLRSVLGRYVSEEVAAIIADQPENFSQSQRGGRREVTVLFADLAGFTTWVETAEPEALVAQLNEYFHAVVDCVLEQGGTLQKFIGDAVLAVWGDTSTKGVKNDASHAVAAALAMQAAVDRLNKDWANRPDRQQMRVGIGLHHGVAMVGNVGHPQRMEFTVLGDVVNVAARLESANRQLHTGILLSETIRQLLADNYRFLPIGPSIFKGKREAVAVFVPIGTLHDSIPVWWSQAESAHANWIKGDFSAAASAYEELAAIPTPHLGYFQYRAGIAKHFAINPPPNWDGVYRFENK